MQGSQYGGNVFTHNTTAAEEAQHAMSEAVRRLDVVQDLGIRRVGGEVRGELQPVVAEGVGLDETIGLCVIDEPGERVGYDVSGPRCVVPTNVKLGQTFNAALVVRRSSPGWGG